MKDEIEKNPRQIRAFLNLRVNSVMSFSSVMCWFLELLIFLRFPPSVKRFSYIIKINKD